ncbi:hypothetical protein FG386_002124 [Cryptosporidium ryanae]|uniref:uncharacterized protein n=1 Tax=Cryptosporidium ryanae TaxID=515981 RepID=UPI00351A8173|nr:hypothetical protein FG386_002124 [Cryptosporidium ryanae]
MADKNWNRLLLDISTNIRSLHDGVNRLPFYFKEKQKYSEYLDDIGALCACIRVFQDAMSPISQQLSLYPFEKIYKDPVIMPDLLSTSISDTMKKEIKFSEKYVQDDIQEDSFSDLNQAEICERINEFNNCIINISQSVSELDIFK